MVELALARQTKTLSVALYLGVNAVLQIIVGPVSDRYGRRPVLLWGAALFFLATIGCLLARSFEVFLFWRMAQAIIEPTTTIFSGATNHHYRRRVRIRK